MTQGERRWVYWGLTGLTANVMSVTALRNRLDLWVMLKWVLGGLSYHKPNGRREDCLLPGTAAVHAWHWTSQTETGYPESWNPAWQFTKHREKMTQRLKSLQGLPRVSASALLPSGCLLYCELAMIIYSRFIFSLSLLSKQKRIGQNSTSVFDRPYFNAEFSQEPGDILR